jgi:hypothetical protein
VFGVPFIAKTQQRIESIQREFTRHLSFLCSDFSHRQPYTVRLAKFELVSLRHRRHPTNMCFLFKLFNGKLHWQRGARWPSDQCARSFSKESHRMGDQNLISQACPCFGRHVKPLVPAAFVSIHSDLKEG